MLTISSHIMIINEPKGHYKMLLCKKSNYYSFIAHIPLFWHSHATADSFSEYTKFLECLTYKKWDIRSSRCEHTAEFRRYCPEEWSAESKKKILLHYTYDTEGYCGLYKHYIGRPRQESVGIYSCFPNVKDQLCALYVPPKAVM